MLLLATAPSAPRHFLFPASAPVICQVLVAGETRSATMTSLRLMYINSQRPLLDLGVPILAPGWRRDHQVRKGVVRKRCVHKQNTDTHARRGPAALWNHFLHSRQPSGGFGRFSARLNKQRENVQAAGVIIPRQVNCTIGQLMHGRKRQRGELAPAGTRAK